MYEHEVPDTAAMDKVKGYFDYTIQLGERLRGRRAAMSKSLLDVERELLIKASHLGAIERADPDVFENQWLIPGYVRGYARYLGLDGNETYLQFCEECGFEPRPTDVSDRKSSRVTRGKQTRWHQLKMRKAGDSAGGGGLIAIKEPFLNKQSVNALASSAVLCGMVVLIGSVGWTIHEEIGKIIEANATESIDVVEQPLSEVDFDTETRVEEPMHAVSIESVLPSTDSAKTMMDIEVGEYGLYSDDPELVPEMETREVSLVQMSESDIPAVNDPLEREIPPEVVAIVPTRPAWIRVKTRGGEVLKEGILAAGERYVIPESDSDLLLRAGNAGSVYLVADGRVFGPIGRGTSVAKNVLLDANSIQEAFVELDSSLMPKEIEREILLTSVRR